MKKNITIIFKDLKIFILQKTAVFIILMISLIATSYAFSFFIANSMHMAKIINEYRNPSTKYSIGSIKSIDNSKIIKLEEWLMQNNLEDSIINLYSNIVTESIKSDIRNTNEIIQQNGDTISGSINTEEHVKYNIIVGSNNNKSKRVSFTGKTISKDDIKNETNYVMLEYLDEKAHKNPFIINSEVEIRGNKYNVQAIDRIDISTNIINFCNTNSFKSINNMTSAVIPISTFKKQYKTYAIDLKVSQNITNKKRNEMSNFLENNFDDCNITSPIRTEDVNIKDVRQNIILFTFLIILALINIIALFTYWINKNWRKYMIYRICGASSKKIYLLVVLEATIIALISTFLGSLIYYLSTPILKNIYINYVLSFVDIVFIQGIIIFIVFFITSFKALKMSKLSPKYMERR